MAERNFPRGLAWALFILFLVAGAALLMSDSGRLRLLGLGLLVAPLLLFLALQLVYYLLDRRHGGAP